MRCLIHITCFIFFPPLLAGLLPEDEFESFYGPSSLNQDSPPDADIFAANPAGDDMKLAATGGSDTYFASGEPSLSSSDFSSTDPDQLFLESGCDTTDTLGFSKLRRRNGASCLEKGETPLITIPIIIPVKPPLPGTGTDLGPVPEIFLELNIEDRCPEPYIHPLCCEWGSDLDVEMGYAANIAVYDLLVGCYISIMTILFTIPPTFANRSQLFPERHAQPLMVYPLMMSVV